MQAGLMREVVVIEEPEETQNELGEMVIVWKPWRRRRAHIENIGYYESIRADQTGGSVSHTATMYYTEGLKASMRFRWESREDRILYITSIVEQGNRQGHQVSLEERA